MSDRLGGGGWPLDRPPRAGELVSLVPRDLAPLNHSLARRDPLRRGGTCGLTAGLPAVTLGTSSDLGTPGASRSETVRSPRRGVRRLASLVGRVGPLLHERPSASAETSIPPRFPPGSPYTGAPSPEARPLASLSHGVAHSLAPPPIWCSVLSPLIEPE